MTKVHQVTCCLLVSPVASLLLLPSDPPQTPATHPRSYRHLAGVWYIYLGSAGRASCAGRAVQGVQCNDFPNQ